MTLGVDMAPSPEKKNAAGNDTTSVSTGFDSDSFYYNPMPLLSYSRISNSNSEKACTCSAMAQVMLDPSSATDGGNAVDVENEDLHFLSRSDLWRQKQDIVASGFNNGEIAIVSICNGLSVFSEDKLKIREGQDIPSFPIVDIIFDSTGTMLCAIDEGGAATIWELKYTVTFQQQSTTSNDTTDVSSSQENPNMFSSIMSALTGMPPPPSNDNTTTTTTTALETDSTNRTSPSSVPQLMASIVNVSRITFPNSWSSPTCLAIDPACKRKRESNLITGFRDGRLVLTRRGGLFQRRNDTVIFHGTPDSSTQAKNYLGIESLAWRGTFVAWADVSGIKLLDIETLTRIAHVDRPTGAQPTLYPTVSDLRPTLLFETSHNLLVSWGDCLMDIGIKETKVPGNESRRQSVECSMAWELDCVSCGVAPLDKDHLIILGLVPPIEAEQNGNDIEVQILSRKDGAVMYCDSLPILKEKRETPIPGLVAESASSYKLLSSFALPRMENSLEVEEFKNSITEFGEEFDVSSLFGSMGGGKDVFCDPHLQWDVKSTFFDGEETNHYGTGDDDSMSVDSDDYGFVLRPIDENDIKEVEKSNSASVNPPMMVIISTSDIVLSKTSTIDDAVGHALSRGRNALALNRGLRYRRQLRRYNIGDLVDHYLQAVLRLQYEKYVDPEVSLPEAEHSLSLRRMQLAVKSMPHLLGNNVEQWEKWAKHLASVTGALFLLREHLPVRDPVLPQRLYEQILKNMLIETEILLQNKNEMRLGQEAMDRFLESIVAWGPTRTLKDYIKLYKSSRGHHKGNQSTQRDLRIAEVSLQRRYLQTAAGYLSFPIIQPRGESIAENPRYEAHKDDSKDSLYLVSNLVKIVALRVPTFALSEELLDAKSREDENTNDLQLNNLISLESMARLRMMQNRFDLALKCFLGIGLYHSKQSLEEIESSAIDTINSVSVVKSHSSQFLYESASKYEFVLAMIEYHHLQRLLLEETLISTDSKAGMPLFSLLRLVGLGGLGRFLIEHCVPPEFSSPGKSSEYRDEERVKENVQKSTLPMDLVANQLQHSPALLHWYLHQVLTKKPELYVKFPNNFVPSKAVRELHRKHFQLFVEFAGDSKDSAKSFSGVEKYKVESKATPLLTFLKAALPVGGLTPVEARRVLETQRNQYDYDDDDEGEGEIIVAGNQSSFSLELAYIVEHYGEETETEAIGILDLYLEGVRSIMLAVSYVQRQRKYSTSLWNKLISYCLSNESGDIGDGVLFGTLLEASAMFGADISMLVARIPPGMVVEGLRPRLVAAVADYRLKLGIHEAAAATVEEEKLSLHREVAHRSRRGARFHVPGIAINAPKSETIKYGTAKSEQTQPPCSPRIKVRRDRYRHNLSYSIPIP